LPSIGSSGSIGQIGGFGEVELLFNVALGFELKSLLMITFHDSRIIIQFKYPKLANHPIQLINLLSKFEKGFPYAPRLTNQ